MTAIVFRMADTDCGEVRAQHIATMTLTGVLGLAQMTCTVSVQGNQLYMLFEADKLLSIATSISSKSASSLSSLLKSYTGLKLGWVMTK